jgi:hypothetical protein
MSSNLSENFTNAVNTTAQICLKKDDTIFSYVMCSLLFVVLGGFAVIFMHVFVACKAWAFTANVPAKAPASVSFLGSARMSLKATNALADLEALETKYKESKRALLMAWCDKVPNIGDYQKLKNAACDELTDARARNKAINASVH